MTRTPPPSPRAGPAPDALGTTVVMSTAAYRDYRVAGPPFLVVVAADAVSTQSVAWGLDQTLEISLAALACATPWLVSHPSVMLGPDRRVIVMRTSRDTDIKRQGGLTIDCDCCRAA